MSTKHAFRNWIILVFFASLMAVSTAATAGDSDDWYSWYKDADGDGVSNRDDDCPGTASGISVDDKGCPRDDNFDSDNDGVRDKDDDCPYTPTGASVTDKGCPYDSDGDGTYDGLDMCPGTPMFTQTDGMGCPLSQDSDGDGVPDSQDQCPGHYDNIDVDNDGIPDGCDPLIDSDGDGVPDSSDKCWGSDDSIDANGNGIPDGCDGIVADDDGDGVANGNDTCPNTPAGTLVDIAGCPVNTPPPPPEHTDPAVCPPGQSRTAGGLSIFGECVTPDDCKACHGHADRFPILNRSIADSHPQHADRNANCLSCHDVTAIASGEGGFSSVDGCLSACHTNLTDLPTNPQGLPLTVIGSPESGTNRHHYTDTFNNESCHACHVLPETQLTSSAICMTCHDGTVAQKDIISSFNQPFAHPLDALGRSVDGMGWNATGESESVSCLDCHNPNQVTSDNLLKGVPGVEPLWPGNWEEVTNYAAVASVEKQYQLCMKCHSYNKFGNNPPLDSHGMAGGDGRLTDQAREFNPNNASYHPVVAMGKNDYKMGNTDYSDALINGWTPTSMMDCDDCHADADRRDIRGPHGSSVWPIAIGPYTKPNGYSESDEGRTSILSNDLCFECHNPNTYGVGGSQSDRSKTGYSEPGEGNLHVYHVADKGARCAACHSAVPHGWKRKALLVRAVGTGADPAPYNAQAGSSRPYGINARVNVDNIQSGQWNEEVCHGPGVGSCD